MFKNFLRYLEGTVRIRVRGAAIERFLNLCSRHDIALHGVERAALDELHATVLLGDFKRLRALMGRTGCGKTTIINLLMRFYDPQSGTISIDGTPIRQVTRKSLRLAYAMVLQDTWLFTGTIRENIAYGRPEATLEQVEEAAKAAHIHEFISSLPQGYDTLLTEAGINISQGQKQLMTLRGPCF